MKGHNSNTWHEIFSPKPKNLTNAPRAWSANAVASSLQGGVPPICKVWQGKISHLRVLGFDDKKLDVRWGALTKCSN